MKTAMRTMTSTIWMNPSWTAVMMSSVTWKVITLMMRLMATLTPVQTHFSLHAVLSSLAPLAPSLAPLSSSASQLLSPSGSLSQPSPHPGSVGPSDSLAGSSQLLGPSGSLSQLSPHPGSVGPSGSSQLPGSSGSAMWSTTIKRVLIQPFTSPTGPVEDISSSPIDVFNLFFTPDLMEEIVKQSNAYARTVMGPEKYDKWAKITVKEFKAFLGFSILMGINHLPSLSDYWSKDPRLRYAPVADHISRDRFRDVSRYLHFVDNDTLVPRGEEGHDRLGKVRPLITHLSTKFAEVYNPHRDVAVDEAMIKFQGRYSLKQYMPLKPTKRGIKVWVAADSTNGYFSRFEIYTGKKGNSTEHGLGARVVKTLTSELKGKHHHVYFDNYFTSLGLLEDLEQDQIYACGTARKDRKGFPDLLKKPNLKDRCVL